MERGQKLDEEFTFVRGVNHCLIIGIDNYENGISPLNNCVRDAEAIKGVLTEFYDFKSDHTTILLNEKATRKSILKKIRSLKDKVRHEDNLIITFSGHGVNIDDVGFWLPQDAVLGEDDTFISTSDIIDRLDSIECRHLLLIIDACFSGSIFTKTRSDDFINGDEMRSSRLGLSASHSRELAVDGEEGEHSPFSTHLITKLKNNNRPLSIGNLAAYVKERVHEDTKGNQSPIFHPLNLKGHDLGEFIFHPKYSTYKFDTVLELIKRNKLEAAKTELKNYCEETLELPEMYPFLICRLKYKLLTEKNEANINFEINECIRIIATYPGKSYQIGKDLMSVLQLISQAEIKKALANLKRLYAKNDLLKLNISLFEFRFSFIEYLYNSGQLKSVHFQDLMEDCVDLLLMFLKNVSLGKDSLKNELVFFKDLFLEEVEVKDVLLLLKDYLLTNYGNCEEWYLLKMLIDRDISNRNKLGLGSIDEQDFHLELNRIRAGLDHLMPRVDKMEGAVYLFEEFVAPIEYPNFEDGVDEHIEKGDISKAMQSIKDKFPDHIFSFISNKYEKYEQENAIGVISVQDYYVSMINISKMILDLYYIYKDAENFTKIVEYRKNSAKKEIRRKVSEKSNEEKHILIKRLIQGDDLNQAITVFKSLNLSPSQKTRLIIEALKNDFYIEDSFFTIKDQDLLAIRRNKISEALLSLLVEVEKN